MFATNFIRLWSVIAVLISAAPLRAFDIGVPVVNRGGPIHQDITWIAVTNVFTFDSTGIKLVFTKDAKNQVIAGNVFIDSNAGNRNTPHYHSDAEQFAAVSNRLIAYLGLVRMEAESGDGERARKALGEALHTLQDFYAHSNWIESGRDILGAVHWPNIYEALGEEDLFDPSRAKPFCTTDPNWVDSGLTELTSGYFNLSQHHLINRGCGQVPPGKCAHGGSSSCPGINKDVPGTGQPGTGQGPHNLARGMATRHTEVYVNKLIEDIKTLSPNPDKVLRTLMGHAEPPAAGPLGTLGFVVDVTGSMGNDIEFVKDQIAEMIFSNRDANQFLLTPFSDPGSGPTIVTPNLQQLRDAVNSLQTPPRHGGDCPELYYTALIQAIGNAQANSAITTYTDDPIPKDQHLAGMAERMAAGKNITLNPIPLFLDCSDEEPPPPGKEPPLPDELASRKLTLTNLVEGTGGLLFDFSLSDVRTRHISREFIRALSQTLFSRDLGTILRVHNERVLFGTIPVDSTVTDLVFYATEFQSSGFSLRRPSGTPVRPGDPDVMFTEVVDIESVPGERLPVFLFLRIKAPEPGDWDFQVIPHGSGAGRPIVAALARSSIQLFDFEFIEPAESISSVHRGFAPILGDPIIGATSMARATVFGSATTPEFRLLDEEGRVLQQLDLAPVDIGASFDEFVGSFPVPEVPFRVSAIGADANGHFYERLFPTLFRPRSVEVTIDHATDNRVVPIGRTTSFTFRVRNFGGPDSFRTSAIATTGFIPPRRGPIPDLILDNNETGTFTIRVAVPDDTSEGAEVDVVASVTSTTDLHSPTALSSGLLLPSPLI